MRDTRLFTAFLVFLAFAFGVIGGSVGINALIKSKDLKNKIKHEAPPGIDIDINWNDIFRSGVVLTVACGLLALTSAFALVSLLHLQRSGPPRPGKLDHSRLFAPLMLFFTLWAFATAIPVTDFAKNRSAKVTATAGGIAIPPTVLGQVEGALGVSPVYWSQHYIHLIAILPWLTVLFGFIGSIALFMYARRPTAPATVSTDGDSRTSMTEKA